MRSPSRLSCVGVALWCALLLTALSPVQPLSAQEEPLRPGEAYVTRFSGTTPGPGGVPVINPNGTVGSIIDVRSPRMPPLGQHWIDEPQRKPVMASQVGQVFGVTLDDASPPNVYLASTAAFGLHRTANNQQWLTGMWGPGGPGAIYRLDASTGYAPRLFAEIKLNGRQNTAAALGNIAYDRTNKQLFVSDLETGMIHRIRAADGADLGFYDHGTQGRINFTKSDDGQKANLLPIAFNPASRARLTDCPTRFDASPQCWNLATTGRRVWGLGVRRDAVRNEVRLYYAVWSSPAFGQTIWNQVAEDEKRNSVWSVGIRPDGGFNTADVRREFILPDFFTKPQDIARAGFSQPVSDITFAECGERPVLLVAERGGMRNLGLAALNPFATPHEARPLRYELDQKGAWRLVGRYDVGFWDRSKDGAPYIRANCAGGIAFGLGYDTTTWIADPAKPGQFVWITGDSLCSNEGPCNAPGTSQAAPQDGSPQPVSVQGGPDNSEVHGAQGMAETAFEEVAPDWAFAPTPPTGENANASGANQAYLIDTDINIDAAGNVIPAELARNDATKIGDIAIYQLCEAPTSYSFIETPPVIDHRDDVSHARHASHSRTSSHYRWGSHDPYFSHNRWGSHNTYWSHNRQGSHNRERSHAREGSHNRERSHTQSGSHSTERSHARSGSHSTERSHSQSGSHNTQRSHSQSGSHNTQRSHSQSGSHSTQRSHSQSGSHNTQRSHSQSGSKKGTSNTNQNAR
jgi:hypothetical protein